MTSSTRACGSAEVPGDNTPTLEVEGLSVYLRPGIPLVENLSFSILPRETVAIVGESGCGKSLTSLAIMGLLSTELTKLRTGSIRFEGNELISMSPKQLNKVRGNRIAMIFQEPLTALNPVMTIGAQIVEAILAHKDMSRSEAARRAVELLSLVRIPDPSSRFHDYPHRLSGGMRQRVTIAMAVACQPTLLIADEPTTALDVTVQAQILDLLADMRERSGSSLLLITHDLGVVAQMADRMIVMYAGEVIETGPVEQVLQAPRHPYTSGLLAARPRGSYVSDGKRLTDIRGTVPAPENRPAGCLFEPRCDYREENCLSQRPELVFEASRRAHRCLHPLEMETAVV